MLDIIVCWYDIPHGSLISCLIIISPNAYSILWDTKYF